MKIREKLNQVVARHDELRDILSTQTDMDSTELQRISKEFLPDDENLYLFGKDKPGMEDYALASLASGLVCPDLYCNGDYSNFFDSLLEQDKEYQKEYEKYNSELQKLYTEQKVRKQKKDNDLLKKIETETIEVTEFMKSARINVDNWNKTYEKGLADKVAVTTKIMDDAQRSTQ